MTGDGWTQGLRRHLGQERPEGLDRSRHHRRATRAASSRSSCGRASCSRPASTSRSRTRVPDVLFGEMIPQGPVRRRPVRAGGHARPRAVRGVLLAEHPVEGTTATSGDELHAARERGDRRAVGRGRHRARHHEAGQQREAGPEGTGRRSGVDPAVPVADRVRVRREQASAARSRTTPSRVPSSTWSSGSSSNR